MQTIFFLDTRLVYYMVSHGLNFSFNCAVEIDPDLSRFYRTKLRFRLSKDEMTYPTSLIN